MHSNILLINRLQFIENLICVGKHIPAFDIVALQTCNNLLGKDTTFGEIQTNRGGSLQAATYVYLYAFSMMSEVKRQEYNPFSNGFFKIGEFDDRMCLDNKIEIRNGAGIVLSIPESDISIYIDAFLYLSMQFNQENYKDFVYYPLFIIIEDGLINEMFEIFRKNVTSNFYNRLINTERIKYSL